MTSAKLLTDGLLDLPSDRGATKLLQTLFADSVQPSHHTCPDHLPFQFAEYTGHWIMAFPNGLVLSIAC